MILKEKITFLYDQNEFSGVCKIAKIVSSDIEKKIDLKTDFMVFDKNENVENLCVIFGTVKQSEFIQEIAMKNNIDIEQVKNKNEVYSFFVDENKIVIIGSDKRGTIYGLFHISEILGISPLINWTEILPKQEKSINIENQLFFSKEPSVKYRGFFINDEWPACGNWSQKRFGGFNSKMYEQVFELLLRLKGNYLWPAMWSARFSDDGPGLLNAEFADELGVIMGASHHEPCCRAGEEYRYLRGKDSIYGDAWNFISNEQGITKFWEDGLKRNGKFENVITVGMRGEADTAILKNATLKDNIELLRNVLKTQNRLIKENVNQDLQKVPRMLALYKEVEPYFYGDKKTKGLIDSPELEGVTLMLCDDNHGNLRTVPTEKMKNHNGGYGMYYHFDYHGSPYSYEWVNTNHLPKVKEQMTAAYDFGIQTLWIVNVGDIFTNEFPLSYFLDLAYDYEKYSDKDYSTQKYTKNWIDFNFGELDETQKKEIEFIINSYTKLAFMRRTESLKSDTFHPVNFNESDKIIEIANSIIEKCEELKSQIPENLYNLFFTQVYVPAIGTMNTLLMNLYAGKKFWFASRNCLVANYYSDLEKKCFKNDERLILECDKTDNQRFFAELWSEHFGFNTWCEAGNSYPVCVEVLPTRKSRFVAYIQGNEKATTGQDWTDKNLFCDDFNNPDVNEAFVNVCWCSNEKNDLNLNFNNENSVFTANIIEDEKPFVTKILIKIDRNKILSTNNQNQSDVLKVSSVDKYGIKLEFFVNLDYKIPNLNYERNVFVQTSSFISIESSHFYNKYEPINFHFEELIDYGKTLSAQKCFPVTKSFEKSKDIPYLEYQFVVTQQIAKNDFFAFDFYLNPSNPAFKDNKMQFMIEINGKKILKNVTDKNFVVGDNQEPWSSDVTNNIRISQIFGECNFGKNILRFYPITQNIVLEKIVIYNTKNRIGKSYLGAPESFYVK